MKCILKDEPQVQYIRSEQPDPTLYFSFLPQYAQ